MLDKPMFWIPQMAGLSLLYVVAAVIAAGGDTHHWTVLLSVALLAIHVLEMPVAWLKLRALKPQPLRLLLLCLLYGLLWWVPAQRGAFKVR